MSKRKSSDNATTTDRVTTHAWEDVSSDAKWSSVQEDEDGNIITGSSGMLGEDDVCMLVRERKMRLEQQDHAQSKRRVVRDMIRHLYLVLDASLWMQEKDFGNRKTRMEVVFQLAGDFIIEFYDQNPLSHLGIITCSHGEAEMVSKLSGTKQTHLLALAATLQRYFETSNLSRGEFSLQNGLEVAGRSLGYVPKHASREVVVLIAALNTCDPGDVLVETLPRLQAANIRVSFIALSAEMHVCRKIATDTHGIMGVCLDQHHLKDMLLQQATPPPSKHNDSNNNTCTFVSMGFPIRERSDVPSLIHINSHKSCFTRTAYLCPRCKAKSSELPTDCQVCGLKLVLAPHLARSFHHLFPVPPFLDVPEDLNLNDKNNKSGNSITNPNLVASQQQLLPPTVISSSSSSSNVIHNGRKNKNNYDDSSHHDVHKLGYQTTSIISSSGADNNNFSNNYSTVTVDVDATLVTSYQDCDRCCFSCLKWIGLRKIRNSHQNHRRNNEKNEQRAAEMNDPEVLRFHCPKCQNVFCADCDAYLHISLHNCPGCLCTF